MKVYEDMYSALIEVYGGWNRMVKVVKDMDRPRNETVKFQLNWSALGNVDVEKAMEFADQMKESMEIAEVLNKAEIVVDRKTDAFDKEEEYNKWVEIVRTQSIYMVAAALKMAETSLESFKAVTKEFVC